jgi:hypothetical protein
MAAASIELFTFRTLIADVSHLFGSRIRNSGRCRDYRFVKVRPLTFYGMAGQAGSLLVRARRSDGVSRTLSAGVARYGNLRLGFAKQSTAPV